MITSSAPGIRPAQPQGPRRRSRAVRPAATSREALRRWGFGGFWERGELQHYATESERTIIDPISGQLRDIDRHSPDDCYDPSGVAWSQIHVLPPNPPTAFDPYPRPRRVRTAARMICWDCKEWLSEANRRAFRREFGDYSLRDAEIAVRLTRIDAGERREQVDLMTHDAADAIYWRNRIEIEQLTGTDLAYPRERGYEQAKLLAVLRTAAPADRASIVADLERGPIESRDVLPIQSARRCRIGTSRTPIAA